jgi:hypothetical protein
MAVWESLFQRFLDSDEANLFSFSKIYWKLNSKRKIIKENEDLYQNQELNVVS